MAVVEGLSSAKPHATKQLNQAEAGYRLARLYVSHFVKNVVAAGSPCFRPTSKLVKRRRDGRRDGPRPHACPSPPLARGELRQLARQLLHLLRVRAGDDRLAGRTTLLWPHANCVAHVPAAWRQLAAFDDGTRTI